MATVRPLILTGSNDLIEMTDSQIDAVKDRCRYVYGANPSVTLSRVNGGNLASITDTRKEAGAAATDVSDHPNAANTPDVTTKTITWDYFMQSAANTSPSVDTNNIAFPIYYNGSNIQSMTLQDVYDTFIYDAIDTILSAVGQPGTYRVHTSTSLSGYTAVSTSKMYEDTRADASDYTAAGIPEALDQEEIITSYYLLKANNISAPSMEEMLFVRNSDNNLQEYSQAGIDAILENCMRHVASEETGSKIRYEITTSSSAVTLGSGMTDTRLDGSTHRESTVYDDADDYRSQEHPDGSPETISTKYLRMYEA